MSRGPPREAADFLVVGIGASAGGLDACRKLVEALPANSGMAFILVQHLDPTHESMMVELLAAHTAMAVRQATDGMALERDHIYVIPPGAYLSVERRQAASFAASSASRRASAFRFPASFASRGPRRRRDFGDPLGNGRGWQSRTESRVTGFFRDWPEFDRLAETIVPDLVREDAPDRPLRIWVAGCSTGEVICKQSDQALICVK